MACVVVVAVEASHREEGIGVVTEDGVGGTRRTDGDKLRGILENHMIERGLGHI